MFWPGHSGINADVAFKNCTLLIRIYVCSSHWDVFLSDEYCVGVNSLAFTPIVASMNIVVVARQLYVEVVCIICLKCNGHYFTK